MFKKTASLLLPFLFAFSVAIGQIIEPVKWNFKISPIASDGTLEATMSASIDQPFHMYGMDMPDDGPVSTSFTFSNLDNLETVGPVVAKGSLITRFEQTFNANLSFYEIEVAFVQKFRTLDPAKPASLDGSVRYMCCNDEQCLPPATKKFSLSAQGNPNARLVPKAVGRKTDAGSGSSSNPGVAKKNVDAAPKVTDNVGDGNTSKLVLSVAQIDSLLSDSQYRPAENTLQSGAVDDDDDLYAGSTDSSSSIKGSLWASSVDEIKDLSVGGYNSKASIWSLFLGGIVAGLLSVITPCVWPVIPMTVSFFIKQKKSRFSGHKLAIFYGFSIVFIYVFLGLFVALFFRADTLNSFSTSAIFNLLMFVMLVVFACSFFGWFDIVLPASWSTYIENKADSSTSTVVSVLLMACALVIVTFSCTGPIIGTMLVSIGTESQILGPVVAMFGFAIALALPFTIFAFFPSWMMGLPKSGNWLNMVKVMLGFFELAFSLKFLSVADQAYGWEMLSRQTFIAVWVVIFFMAGFYVMGYYHLPHDQQTLNYVPVSHFMIAIGLFSFGLYMVPGLFGAPLKCISAFAPPADRNSASLYGSETVVAKYRDYERAVDAGKRKNKPILVDFTGYGCVNCRKMESSVWNDSRVAGHLKNNFVMVSLFVDDKKELPKPIEVVENNGEKIVLRTVGEKWCYLQRNKFGANTQPFYVILSPEGHVLTSPFSYTENPLDFADFLINGYDMFEKDSVR